MFLRADVESGAALHLPTSATHATEQERGRNHRELFSIVSIQGLSQRCKMQWDMLPKETKQKRGREGKAKAEANIR
jgi:hypothetical protein